MLACRPYERLNEESFVLIGIDAVNIMPSILDVWALMVLNTEEAKPRPK